MYVRSGGTVLTGKLTVLLLEEGSPASTSACAFANTGSGARSAITNSQSTSRRIFISKSPSSVFLNRSTPSEHSVREWLNFTMSPQKKPNHEEHKVPRSSLFS